ncbi:4-hydroxy-2-oxoheptanedioate aldolase [Brucellaceae bacterium C25G]
MMSLQNKFKTALKTSQCQIGLWLGLANEYSTELCAGAGFDWLLIDGEHAPNDINSTLRQLQVLANYKSHPIVRPPIGNTVLIKQYLDIGAQTLLIPMVETGNQARELAAAMLYPPHGLRGVGSALARASAFNRMPNYLHEANDQTCLLVQVESRTGLENIYEIANVTGVDGVFIGPADLAAALGHLGNPFHPDVQTAIEYCITRITAANKAPGILMADEAMAQRYIKLGAKFVAVASDIGLLVQATSATLKKYKNPETRPLTSTHNNIY